MFISNHILKSAVLFRFSKIIVLVLEKIGHFSNFEKKSQLFPELSHRAQKSIFLYISPPPTPHRTAIRFDLYVVVGKGDGEGQEFL